MTDVSPIHPPMLPMKRYRSSPMVNPSRVPLTMRWVFIAPRGVAVVRASTAPEKRGLGLTQVVICTGKEIKRMTLATNAGLKGLYPNPP